jgi:hypothetical protein
MSFLFDSSYDRIERTANLPLSDNYTMSGWFRSTGVTADGAINTLLTLTENYNGVAATLFQGAHLNTATALRYRRNVTSNVDWNLSHTDSVWIYIAITCAGTGTDQYKGYWWNANGTLGGSFSTTTSDAGATANYLFVGSRAGNTLLGNAAYIRVWDRVLTQANLEAEMFSATIVNGADINTALGTNDFNDVSGNGRNWTAYGVDLDTSGTIEPPIVTAVKKLKVLVHPDAASATGVEGIVWNASAGIAGAEYGEFTGKTFEATTEGSGDAERAVLLVPVADFGGGALNVDDVVPCLVRNATYTTGLITGTVIEE